VTENQSTNTEAQRAVLRLLDIEQGLAALARQLAHLDQRLAALEARLTDSSTDTKE